MTMFVKICGLTDETAAAAAVEAGVQAVGFVFAESPRQVSVRRALAIARSVPPHVARVAGFRRPSRDDVSKVVDGFAPDLVQADHDCAEGLEGVPFLPVYRDGEGVAPDGGRFLYEGPISGIGRRVDTARAAGMARLGEMILAGGLRPDNVGRAIEAVRPFGVDVSSGVESSPGVKSLPLIRSFVTAVRMAEERLVST